MAKAEQEGVIKYACDFEQRALPAAIPLAELNSWRSLMLTLGMIGQAENRYGGLGFGNISQRASDLMKNAAADAFIISGTQTGHLQNLQQQDVALVTNAKPQLNHLSAQGLTPPSSEALTHAVIYQQHPQCSAVVHVHCPIIWHKANELELPCTAASIPYGTPAMAAAIADLLQESLLQEGLLRKDQLQKIPVHTLVHPFINNSVLSKNGIIVMLGHEDGVISYAPTLEEASLLLVRYQVLATQLSQRS